MIPASLLRVTALAAALVFSVIAFNAGSEASNLTPLEPTDEILVFHCSPGPGFDICSDSPQGDDWQALTNDSTSDAYPALSPDGTQIAWERNLTEIWVMDSDGSNQHRILPDVFSNLDAPTWSPDGTHIAFGCSVPGDLNNDAICMSDPAVENDIQVLVDELDPRPNYVEWNPVNPDLMLLTIETQSVNEDIFIYEISTGQMTNITNTPDEWEHGTWSPDGKTIAFAGTPLPSESTSTSGFYKINPDGSGRTNLYTPAQGVPATHPAWSPEGDEIAGFCAQRSICVVSPDGGLIREMMEDNEDEYYLGRDIDWGFTEGPLFGDLDCDGDVDLNDMLLSMQNVAGVTDNGSCLSFGQTVEVNGMTMPWGDLNCDGQVGLADSLPILLREAGTPDVPEGCPVPGQIARILH